MIVVESPLAGDTARNKRFAAWCCRAVWEVERVVAIASHLICPQYLDDRVEEERAAGMALKVCWLGDTHYFFVDLKISGGMRWGHQHCVDNRIETQTWALKVYHPPSWEAFQRGEWPPCTPGFGPSEIEQIFQRLNADEQTVLLELARRLEQGRATYGPLDMATDKRDMVEESHQEFLDGAIYLAVRTLQKAKRKARQKLEWRTPRPRLKPGQRAEAVLVAVDGKQRSATELSKRCGLTRKETYATLERLVEKEKVRVTKGRWPKYWRGW